MGLIVVLVFVGVFVGIALPLAAGVLTPSQTARQALATLHSALQGENPETRQQAVDLRKNDQLSSIPWLNRKLLRLELAPLLHRMLSQADLKWSAGRLMAMTGVCFALPTWIVYLRFGAILPALAAGLGLGFAPMAWVLFKRSRRFDKFEKALPEALDLMVSGLRAGHSLSAAMGLVARECTDPVGTEFRVCFEEQNFGLEMKTALDNLLDRVPMQDLRIVATAIMIQKESGGNLAEVLDKTSNLIRERFRLKRQIRVHTAQGRLTGWILTFVPVVLGVVMYFVNPKMMSVLWQRPVGIKMIWAAAGLIVIGGIIINRIVDVDV